MDIENRVLNSFGSTSLNHDGGSIGQLLKILEAGREKVRNNAKKEITFSDPILYKDGSPLIYPNTINLVQGKSGTHKSRLMETIASVLLSAGKTSHLGLKANGNREFYILYVDTERNLNEQFPYAIQQIKKLAGFDIGDEVEFLDFVSLIDISREKRFSVLDAFLNKLRQNLDMHLVVILDVVTDCVEDFNNARKSMELIDMMVRMINGHNLTYFCVIHENPQGGDKARGHLGTELNNKSSATLQIKFEGENSNVLKVTLLKGRSIKSGLHFFVTYSEEHKRLVLANQSQIKDAQNSKQKTAPIEEVKRILLEELLKEPVPKDRIMSTLTKSLDCSERTIAKRIKVLLDDKELITDGEDNQFVLKSDMKGKKRIYRLTPFVKKSE